MKKQIFLLFLALSIFQFDNIFGQSEYVKDSIEIEKGIPGSTEFEPMFKAIVDDTDENGRTLQMTIYVYLSEDQLRPLQRYEYQYEGEDIYKFTIHDWNTDMEEWQVKKEESSTYENGLIKSFLREKGTEGVLTNYRRWLYLYDDNENETEALLQEWNTDIEEWEQLSRRRTSYTPENNISIQLLQRYFGGEWINRSRRAWTWEADNIQPSATIVQRWSVSKEMWINQNRKSYIKQNNGLWGSAVIEEWNEDSEQWESDIREAFDPNVSNATGAWIADLWNGEWQPKSRNEYGFTSSSNTATLKQWSEENMEHENNLRHRAVRDENGLIVEKTGMQKWNGVLSLWENQDYTRRIKYFWSEKGSTAIPETEIEDWCSIPNPYQIGQNFYCDIPLSGNTVYLEVSNLAGQVVSIEDIKDQNIAIKSAIPPGMYIIKILDQNQIYHLEKIVVSN